MATLQIGPDIPQITPAQSLIGWRRELCVELLGDGTARMFVRAVERRLTGAPSAVDAMLHTFPRGAVVAAVSDQAPAAKPCIPADF